jgi:hypothetical protein
MSACLSRLVLSSWEAEPEQGRSAEIHNHVNACSRCSTIVADLSESRALLLGADPEATSLRAAKAILATAANRRPMRSLWRFLAPAMLVPAAAIALFALNPSVLSPTQTEGQGSARVKGQLIVEAFCKRGEEVFPLAEAGEFVEGDRLRFAYTKDAPGKLMVFSVDDNGVISPYYQESGLTPMPVVAGSKVMLPGSIELDNHRGWERVFAIWSASPLADDQVRKAVAAAFSAAEGDVRRVSSLDLPAEQVSFLLRRL